MRATDPSTDATTRQAEGQPAVSRAGAFEPTANVVSAVGVRKAFGPTVALRDCSLDLRGGEIHVLMGENGSGKSTLVKLLSGVHRPDCGALVVTGREYAGLRSPRAAIAAGISTVFQETLVVPQQSVLANVWLGSDGIIRRLRSAQARREEAEECLGRLVERLDLSAPTGALSLRDRQAVCITRALLSHPKLLILDESTSALDVVTRDNLFVILRRLREEGVAVLFISHRMDEVEEIADQITVLRSGERVATAAAGELSTRELVELMTGEKHNSDGAGVNPSRRASRKPGAVALRTVGIQVASGAAPIDLEFRAGEIVGLAGLEGHGQDRFLQALAGVKPIRGAVVALDGASERELRSRREAFAAGIAYIPRERRDESLLETRSIVDNYGLKTLRSHRRRGFIDAKQMQVAFAGYVDRLKIKVPRHSLPVTALSGGNQQKVILARWLAMSPKVLLLNDPTRGIDIAAKHDIYELLRSAAAESVCVVMLTTELIELMDLMDRVVVFRENEVFANLPRETLSSARLVGAYFGKRIDT